MPCNHATLARRPARVMAELPKQAAGVDAALRRTFGVSDDIPADLSRLVDRLCRVR